MAFFRRTIKNPLHILVTGGAGFVGSHLANRLFTQGHHVTVADNLSNGFQMSLLPGIDFLRLDLADYENTEKAIVALRPIDAIFHLASLINVKESCDLPNLYFKNNVSALETLLEISDKLKCRKVIFASSGSVYGDQKNLTPFSEDTPLNPVSPYSNSKVLCEEVLKTFTRHKNYNAAILRYSNVAGSALNLSNGQRTAQPYHVFHRAGLTRIGNDSNFQVFGFDYPTADGTAVRDFIHIEDLIDLNILTLNYLLADHSTEVLTLNAGANYPLSVLEVFKAVNALRIDQHPPKQNHFFPRRSGDPAYLVSDSQKIHKLLNWKPQWSNRHLISVSTIGWLEKLRGTTVEPSI